jgi:putative component of membrane protein insertase Oxa1/YidC/SpoIIIJ protein YidD
MRINVGVTALARRCTRWEAARLIEPLVTFLAMAAVRAYRLTLSGRIGVTCMFRPSCSEFAIDALRKRGWNSARHDIDARLARCDGVYVATHDGTGFEVRTSDGLELGEADLSERFLGDLYSNHRHRLEGSQHQ